MQTSKLTSSSLKAVEGVLTDAVHQAEGMFRERWEKVEDKIRESPTKAVLIAAGIGYLMHRLPFRSLCVTQLKLLWALAPPAVMAVAAGKGFQALDEHLHANGNATAKSRSRSAAEVS